MIDIESILSSCHWRRFNCFYPGCPRQLPLGCQLKQTDGGNILYPRIFVLAFGAVENIHRESSRLLIFFFIFVAVADRPTGLTPPGHNALTVLADQV